MNLHSLAAHHAMSEGRKGQAINPYAALMYLKEMGFFRKPMAIHVRRALRYEYGR